MKNPVMNNRVSLLIGWNRWEGWTDIRVSRSIDQAAGEFTLAVTERVSGHIKPFRILPGDPCLVRIGDDPVITGHVEDMAPSYDAQHHAVTLSGRSLTADLVDCSAPPLQMVNSNVERIAAMLAEPYKVKVRAEVDTGPAFPDFQVHPGETVFAAIHRIARTRGLVVTDDPTGMLVLTRAAASRAKGSIRLGLNILAGRGAFSQRYRYSDYLVKGQRAGDDVATDVGEFGAVEAGANDGGIKRFRQLIVVNDSPGNRWHHLHRAQWEATRRAGESLEVNYTVQGWRDPAGALWRPNTLVRVLDEWLGIDRDLLITSTEFTLSNAGSKTELRLAPKEAYELMPEAPKAAAIGYAIGSPDSESTIARRPHR